jgi:hypothetical protein
LCSPASAMRSVVESLLFPFDIYIHHAYLVHEFVWAWWKCSCNFNMIIWIVLLNQLHTLPMKTKVINSKFPLDHTCCNMQVLQVFHSRNMIGLNCCIMQVQRLFSQ